MKRLFDTDFWTDAVVEEEFDKDDILFMIYMLTAPKSNLSGCFEVSIKQICDHTKMDRQTIEKEIDKFQNVYKKVFYNRKNREVLVVNFPKWNWNVSPKTDKAIRNFILAVKTGEFKKILIEKFNAKHNVRVGLTPEIHEDDDPQMQIEDYKEEEDRYIPPEEEQEEKVQDQQQIELQVTEFPKPEVVETKKSDAPYDEIKELYHEICISYPKLVKFTKVRKGLIHARWIEYGENIEVFRQVFTNMQNSNFLKGQNSKNWSATFDWAMRPENFMKVLEGNYVNKSGRKGSGWDVIRNEAWGDVQ